MVPRSSLIARSFLLVGGLVCAVQLLIRNATSTTTPNCSQSLFEAVRNFVTDSVRACSAPVAYCGGGGDESDPFSAAALDRALNMLWKRVCDMRFCLHVAKALDLTYFLLTHAGSDAAQLHVMLFCRDRRSDIERFASIRASSASNEYLRIRSTANRISGSVSDIPVLLISL